jgi:hypothetical protein
MRFDRYEHIREVWSEDGFAHEAVRQFETAVDRTPDLLEKNTERTVSVGAGKPPPSRQ